MRLALALVVALAGPAAAGEAALPDGWVRLADLAPGVDQDIRYARDFNFTGAPVPGYDAPACILRREAAEALVRAEARLRAGGLRLIVFDCYRPAQAVAAFLDWTEGKGAPRGALFFPGLDRADLVPGGYIARDSSHSRGLAVDVGLESADALPRRAEWAPGLRCDGPPNVRPDESSLDMGTSFDCFSPLSAIGAAVSPEAARNRARLAAALAAEGFRAYDREWWHFRLAGMEPGPALDFPVTQP